jgi:radical SAM-linked protein
MLLLFQKGEQVRHLGHLDLQRTMQRALRRSGLPIAYSQGFHPHVLLAFASALSVGVSSDGEIADAPLSAPASPEACLQRMNAVLPPALAACRVRLVTDHHPGLMGLLKQAAYDVLLPGADAAAFADAATAFLARDEVTALRRSKRGETRVNIRPMAHAVTVTPDEAGTRLTLRLSLEETATLKPLLLIQTLADLAGLPEPRARIHRLGLYGLPSGVLTPLMDC